MYVCMYLVYITICTTPGMYVRIVILLVLIIIMLPVLSHRHDASICLWSQDTGSNDFGVEY